MEFLVNERVMHSKFGAGSIVEEPGERIIVRFQENDTVRHFMFPEAFESFLRFEDEGLQERYGALAVARRRQNEKGRMSAIREKEQERREQLEMLKPRKSTPRTKAAVKQKVKIQEGQQ